VTSTKRFLGRKESRNRNENAAGHHDRLRHFKGLLAFGLDYLFATVKAGWADMVTQMGLARGRLDRRCGVGQKIMGAVHTTLGRGFFILLYCHGDYS
jgi:hypothetical protein